MILSLIVGKGGDLLLNSLIKLDTGSLTESFLIVTGV